LDFLFNQKNKTIIIGGGETASLIKDKTNLENVYVSTGGGALLEYLQNKILYNKTLVGLEIYI
jgi:3-phosphoglycerate kinase